MLKVDINSLSKAIPRQDGSEPLTSSLNFLDYKLEIFFAVYPTYKEMEQSLKRILWCPSKGLGEKHRIFS